MSGTNNPQLLSRSSISTFEAVNSTEYVTLRRARALKHTLHSKLPNVGKRRQGKAECLPSVWYKEPKFRPTYDYDDRKDQHVDKYEHGVYQLDG